MTVNMVKRGQIIKKKKKLINNSKSNNMKINNQLNNYKKKNIRKKGITNNMNNQNGLKRINNLQTL